MALLKNTFSAMLILSALSLVACKKNNYFEDTGKHTANFNGTVLDYLKSKPEHFDSLVKIISIAGMDNIFNSEEITFFAPADSSLRSTINDLNLELNRLGKPSLKRLEQIKPAVWRQQLSRYLFKGKKSMFDYPQLDPGNISAYPGQIYASYDNDFMNVGVIYNPAGGVQYAGYRQLNISFIPSPTTPRDFASWNTALVASANIAPTNGFVHVINYSNHFFGFAPNQFIEEAIAKGIL